MIAMETQEIQISSKTENLTVIETLVDEVCEEFKINEDYYGLGVIASKSVSENSTLGLSYDYFDSDLISDGESVVGLSLSVNF